MNCPTCGAPNDADARFCAECGTPLENPDNEATIIGQRFNIKAELGLSDEDLFPGADDSASEAKTVAVDQGQLAEALQDVGLENAPDEPSSDSLMDSALAALSPTGAEDTPPSPPPPPLPPDPVDTGVALPPPPLEEEEPAVVDDEPPAAVPPLSEVETPPTVDKSGQGSNRKKCTSLAVLYC
jgi:hypothetical protein